MVVDDAYNSNPRALQGALGVIADERRFDRRVAVLGEMLELGAESTRCTRRAVGRPPARGCRC